MASKPIWDDTPTVPRQVMPPWAGSSPPAYYDPPQPRSRSLFAAMVNLMGVGLGLSLGGLLTVLVMLVGGTVLFYNSDFIVPGVEVVGIDVGGHSTAEAIARLEQQWQQRAITLQAAESTIVVEPAFLGVTLDAEATIQAAYRQGRSPVMFREWLQRAGPLEVTPVWRFDPAIAEANLRTVTTEFDQEPVNASIQRVADRVEIMPPVVGQTLNVEATVSELRRNFAQAINDGQLTLVMQPVQPTISDVSEAAAQANRLLAHRLTIKLYDPIKDERLSWEVTPTQWKAWLSFDITDHNQPKLIWEVDTAQVDSYLTEQMVSLGDHRYLPLEPTHVAIINALTEGQDTIKLQIRYRERAYTVQYGETLSSIANKVGLPYPWIEQANPDRGETLAVGQVITIPSPEVMLPLPVVEDKRIVVSISEQKMWVYENGQEKWVWPASTGIASSPTAPGVFQIQSHQEEAYAENWDLWMPHFMGIYRPAPYADFMNGIHGFPTRNNWQLLWTNDLGHPVTYGCILIDSDNAAELFAWAEEGTVVEIRP